MNSLSKNIFAGMLIMSAIVMIVLLVADPSPKRAEAVMMSQSGDIVLITTSAIGQDDLLSVLDTRNGKMITYGYNSSSHRMQAVAAERIFR
jgi:hypothetical protein